MSVLLLLAAPGTLLRVNGNPVCGGTLVGVKDEIQLAEGALLHVTMRSEPFLGSPPAELIGQACPVCRVPFAVGTRVLRCGTCSVVVHAEADTGAADERLECDLLARACPGCRAPLRRDARPGFVYEPEES